MNSKERMTIALDLGPKIKNIIYNDPATIVLVPSDQKTIVKCSENDIFDPMVGLSMAINKKILGDSYKQTFKKWLPKENVEETLGHVSNICDGCVNHGVVYKLGTCLTCALSNGHINYQKKKEEIANG